MFQISLVHRIKELTLILVWLHQVNEPGKCSLRNAKYGNFPLRVICRTFRINNSANYTFRNSAFHIPHNTPSRDKLLSM